MITIDTILNALNDYFGWRDDAYEELRNLKDEIKNNPERLIEKIEETIERDADDNNICPICGTDLETKVIRESRGEYMGKEVYEPIYQAYCPICSWKKNH